MNRAEAIPVDGSRSTTEPAGDPPATLSPDATKDQLSAAIQLVGGPSGNPTGGTREAPARLLPRVRPPAPALAGPAARAERLPGTTRRLVGL